MIPSQQQGTTSFQNHHIPWLLRLCQWLWRRPFPFLWFTVITNVTINIGSTWLITPANNTAIPETSFLGGFITLVSTRWLFSITLAAISTLLLLSTWLGNRLAKSLLSMPTQAQMSVHDREHLVRRLRLHYEQMLSQSLQGAVQVELGLASRPAAIHNATGLAWRLPEQPEQLLSPDISIVDVYTQANQELLLLGEPGAGKSTLLLELTHHLIEQAEQDSEQRLPILFPLSSWAVKRLPLQDWLIEQFTSLYAVPKKLSKQWIQAELVFPLLDGLDEMEEPARPACIEAINTYHLEHLGPLVVCSRTQEYDTAAHQKRLKLQNAVVIQQLSLAQVDAHLAALGKPFARLRNALKKQPSLQALATTPLMLQILMLTYQNTAVRKLSQQAARLQRQIWADFVQRMVARKGDTKRYPLLITISRLTWLASHMRQHNQSIFLLEQLQPDWLSRKQRILYQASIALLFVLAAGLVIVLVAALVAPTSKLTIEVLSAMIVGLLIPGASLQETKIQPTEVLSWSWKKFRFGLVVGLVVGLILGLIVGLSVRLGFGLVTGLGFGLYGEIYSGLYFGISPGQLSERLALSPNEGIRRSFKYGLLLSASGLIVGLVAALVGNLILGPSSILVGILVGLGVGLVGIGTGGLGAVFQHYTLRFWLCISGFPYRVVPFLEDATARILLRRVGGGYSFTHRLLLDYFADLDTTAISVTASAASPIPPSP